MNKIDSILSQALLEKELITKDFLAAYAKEAQESNRPLALELIRRAVISEEEILRIYAQKLKVRLLDLKSISVEKSVIDAIPMKVASYYRFIPVEIKERMLTLAVSFPMDVKTQDEIRTQLGYDIEIALAPSADIIDGLKQYYGLTGQTLQKIVMEASQGDFAPQQPPQEKIEDIERLAEDASVIKLVNQIILEAWRRRSTDIHIEPYRDGVFLRYRIDGLLYDANVPAEIKNFINAIISRVKIMSNLNIVERRLPQDGRAVVKVQDQTLDLRISTIPTPFGESVVIRILPTKMLFSLERLGLAKRELLLFEELIKKPHGIIFVTGPTGSGKTTTLYACLSRINTRERKIITIEDPIEYEMEGITQIQVMPQIGLDFALGLRSLLRHDPDVIMVGEVRDLETAEIAIRVALTGHLVYSTLHTNDAASGITRLIDIGLEPYLVASSVEAFIAQRLIRVICQYCKVEEQAAPIELKTMIAKDLELDSPDKVQISRGKGCPHCNFTGFFGRTAIYEIILVDDLIKDMILKKIPSGQIKKLAISRGMRTLRQDGWQKVILGQTTPEEVMKVTSVEDASEGVEKGQVSFPAQGAAGSAFPDEPDNRAYNRLSSRVNLRYKVFRTADELTKRGYTLEQLSVSKNISAGGILFVSAHALMIGSFLELVIELPDGNEPVECLAKVVRIQQYEDEATYGIAIRFLDISGDQRARLDMYVEKEGK